MPDVTPIEKAQDAILAAQREIALAITSYPAPISGCDAQFNHLLDCRRRLERARIELGRPEFVPTPRQPN